MSRELSIMDVSRSLVADLDAGRVPDSHDLATGVRDPLAGCEQTKELHVATCLLVELLDAYANRNAQHTRDHVRRAVGTLIQIARKTKAAIRGEETGRDLSVDMTVFRPLTHSTRTATCDPTFQRCEFVTRKSKDEDCEPYDFSCRARFAERRRVGPHPHTASASFVHRPQDVFLMRRSEREESAARHQSK